MNRVPLPSRQCERFAPTGQHILCGLADSLYPSAPQETIMHQRLMSVALIGLCLHSATQSRAGDEALYETPLGTIGVELSVARSTVVFNEPVSLTFTVRNLNDIDLQTIQGGDYRNRYGRPERFSVTTVDSDGQPAPFLEIGPGHGGIVGPQDIPAADTWTRRLFLPNWVRIDSAGEYTITCSTSLELYDPSESKSWLDNSRETIQVDVSVTAPLTVKPYDYDSIGEVIELWGPRATDRHWEVSAEAFDHLLAIHDERVIPFLNRALRTNNYSLKFNALRGLRKYNHDDALAGIREGLKTEPRDMEGYRNTKHAKQGAEAIRFCSASALTASPHPNAEPLTWTLVDDSNQSIRLHVMQALASKEDSPRTRALLERNLDDSFHMIRKEARRFLDEMNRKDGETAK